MIAADTLKYLAAQKLRDAEVLLNQNRHNGAVYLMGYALEFSFKRKIIGTLGFVGGFPETPVEFGTYSAQIAAFNAIGTGISLSQVQHIRNHKLNSLIIFSGAEPRIISNFLSDWVIVRGWNPEDRYKLRRYSKEKAKNFLRSAKVIIGELI